MTASSSDPQHHPEPQNDFASEVQPWPAFVQLELLLDSSYSFAGYGTPGVLIALQEH